MEKLIIIEGKDKYKYDNPKDLIKNFIDKSYFDISREEKNIILEKKAIANTMKDNIKIVKLKKFPDDYEDNAFILYNEISYILSLLKFNKIILLERTDANIFGRYINKESIEDNYIIVNKFANEILKKYLKEKYND